MTQKHIKATMTKYKMHKVFFNRNHMHQTINLGKYPTYLFRAIFFRDINEVERILTTDPQQVHDQCYFDEDPLSVSIRTNDLELVRILHKYGSPITTKHVDLAHKLKNEKMSTLLDTLKNFPDQLKIATNNPSTTIHSSPVNAKLDLVMSPEFVKDTVAQVKVERR